MVSPEGPPIRLGWGPSDRQLHHHPGLIHASPLHLVQGELDPVAMAPTPSATGELLTPLALVIATQLSVDMVAGDDMPPSRPGWGDWRGCFDHEAVSCCVPAPSTDLQDGWHLITRCRSPPPMASHGSASIGWSTPPAWLRHHCFRCLSKVHRALECRDPIRCM